MVITAQPLAVIGSFELRPTVFSDSRGTLVKMLHEAAFAEAGLRMQVAEQYYSVSRRGVVRGLHMQVPPAHHTKVVYCVAGSVLDVVVDLRKGSPTFGATDSRELTAAQGNGMYMPAGVAHGFLALSDSATVLCATSTVYSPQHDAGVRWDSVGFAWPVQQPLLSERDQRLPSFAEFETPFVYGDPAEARRE